MSSTCTVAFRLVTTMFTAARAVNGGAVYEPLALTQPMVEAVYGVATVSVLIALPLAFSH